MRHTIEYNGVRKTVEAPRTASVIDVADIAFGPLPTGQYAKVIVHGSGSNADPKVARYTFTVYITQPISAEEDEKDYLSPDYKRQLERTVIRSLSRIDGDTDCECMEATIDTD